MFDLLEDKIPKNQQVILIALAIAFMIILWMFLGRGQAPQPSDFNSPSEDNPELALFYE